MDDILFIVISILVGVLFLWKGVPFLFFLLIDTIMSGLGATPQDQVVEHENYWKKRKYNVTTDRVGSREYSKASHPRGPEYELNVPRSYALLKFLAVLAIMIVVCALCVALLWRLGLVV